MLTYYFVSVWACINVSLHVWASWIANVGELQMGVQPDFESAQYYSAAVQEQRMLCP